MVQALLERKAPVAFVPGEVIVKRKMVAGVAAAPPTAKLRQLELEQVRTTSGGETVYRISPSVTGSMTREQQRDRTLDAVESLRADPGVEYVQPNYILRIATTTPNDPSYPMQWHYRDNGAGADQSPGGIGLPTAWDTTRGDSSVVVAVIDTGILPAHPDIAGSPNLVTGYDMITDSFTANDGDGRDADPADPGDALNTGECGPGDPPAPLPSSWHGTHVAGTVGVGRTNNGVGVAGINWTVSLQAVRVLGKCGGTVTDINDGIRWAAGLAVPGVPPNATKARVLNMSLGAAIPCTSSPSTQAAIDDAVNAGATVVVAAGNDATDASQEMPAGCNNVITVAASDYRGHLVTRYSNFGSAVEILAPGGDVQRDDDNDSNPDGVYSMVQGGYAFYNGTSMAAPHVTGVAALVLAHEPALTPAQVAQRLQQTARPRSASECPKPCGAGLLDAAAALRPSGPLVSLTVDYAASPRLKQNETRSLTATLTRDGQPLAGKTVSFSSADPAIATVSPASAATDASGKASATVTAQAGSQSQTVVTTAAEGRTQSTTILVPSLSTGGALVAALGLLVAFLLTIARRAT
jgi:serine protease